MNRNWSGVAKLKLGSTHSRRLPASAWRTAALMVLAVLTRCTASCMSASTCNSSGTSPGREMEAVMLSDFMLPAAKSKKRKLSVSISWLSWGSGTAATCRSHAATYMSAIVLCPHACMASMFTPGTCCAQSLVIFKQELSVCTLPITSQPKRMSTCFARRRSSDWLGQVEAALTEMSVHSLLKHSCGSIAYTLVDQVAGGRPVA